MTARRSTEWQPEWKTCRWLQSCHGAAAVRAEWEALGLWCPPLWNALDVPKLSRLCTGCPLMESEAA